MERLIAAVVLAACGGGIVDLDAPRVDSGSGSFEAPIGAPCDEVVSHLCAGGVGACFEAVCRKQCHPGVPRCTDGEVERHDTVENADRCVCIPP